MKKTVIMLFIVLSLSISGVFAQTNLQPIAEVKLQEGHRLLLVS